MRESKIVSCYCFIFVITSFLNTNCAGSKSLNSSNATPNLDPIDTTSSLSTLPRSQSISKPEKNNQRILVSENNNISEFMSSNGDDAKQTLTNALSEIEAAMLDVRQEYKSGKISSVDYLAKTQDLYKKGEELVEKQVS